jgi:tetratricopeptide (TPR) repeat protein/DNA-binding CsgD family transcriptional regulator
VERPRWHILVLTLGVFAFIPPAQGGSPRQASVGIPNVIEARAHATEEWRLGNHATALEQFLEVYAIDSSAGNLEGMAIDLNQIGLALWRLNDCVAAMEAFHASARLAEKCGMDRLLGLTYLNRSILLNNDDQADSAFLLNAKALAIFTRIDLARDVGLALNNEGQINKKLGRHAQAEACYRRSLRVHEAVADTDGMATAWFNLADVNARVNRSDSAFTFAQRALAMAHGVRTKVRVSETLQLLSRLHEDIGQADSALHYYKLYASYLDSLSALNKTQALAVQQARFGSELKDLRIRALQDQQALQRMRALAGIATFILLGLVFGLVVRRHWQKLEEGRRSAESERDTARSVLNARDAELREHLLALSAQAAEIERMKLAMNEDRTEHVGMVGEVAELRVQKILTEQDWLAFKERFSSIYPAFFTRLRAMDLSLTESDLRYMVLLRLGLAPKEMAELLGISPQSARVGKMRLRKKLSSAGHELDNDLLERLIA